MSDDLALWSIAELSAAIARRDISPVDLVQSCIARIEALDGRLHAFNCVRTEAALAEARAAETAVGRSDLCGPLHGIPVGIKDLIDVAGVPTTAQSAHRMDAVAAQDAGVVSALRRAGAIILGKTATAEYAAGGTQFDLPWPPPRNPWDLDRDASSSSSGSAVAVAAGLCVAAVGTETAGSIRAPAAWCGIAGLKPTDRLVARSGVLWLSRTVDCVGPMAQTVGDCAAMLSGMISDDPDDRARPGFRVPDLSGRRDSLKGLRVGVVRHFYEGDGEVDAETLDATESALALLRDLGVTLSTVRLAEFADYSATAKAITWPEEYAEHGQELRDHPDRFGAVTRSRLQDGLKFTAPDYVLALRRRDALIADLATTMRDVDALVLPTMKKPAQPLGYEGFAGAVDLSLNRPFNLTGNPALALVSGFSAGGLPLSIQIVGRPYEDDRVLSIGARLEEALGFVGRRPAIAVSTRATSTGRVSTGAARTGQHHVE